MVSRNEAAFFLAVVLFALAVSLIAYFLNAVNPYNLAARLFALNGFIALSIASILTAFLKEVTLFFKKPFTRIHHYFAATGLVLITLHPITLAVQLMNPAVFLPNINSLYLFLFFGGRQALIIIYIALAAVLLRRKISTYWVQRRFFVKLEEFCGENPEAFIRRWLGKVRFQMLGLGAFFLSAKGFLVLPKRKNRRFI